jgi:hypothetical protein
MKKLFALAAPFVLGLTMVGGEPAWAGSCAGESGILQRLEVESILEDVGLIHSIDPGLLSAIATVESGRCSEAVSPKGAAGIMQLMPATASAYGVDDRFDPVQNALGAARFIAHLKRDRPGGSLSLPEILAAYNAGEGAVTRAGGIPHYRETEQYVRRVLWLYLLGHVPESERTLDRSRQSKPKIVSTHVSTTGHRYAPGSDSAILEQLAEVRHARQRPEATTGQ